MFIRWQLVENITKLYPVNSFEADIIIELYIHGIRDIKPSHETGEKYELANKILIYIAQIDK